MKFYADMVRALRAVDEGSAVPVRGKRGKQAKMQQDHQPGRDGQLVEIHKAGSATTATRDHAADAVFWLATNGHLNSREEWPRTEEKKNQAHADGNERLITAQKLESLFEKAELTPIRSPDFASTPGGGFGSRVVGASKIQAMQIIQHLRQSVPAETMNLLERVIVRNEHVWHGLPYTRFQQALQNVRMAIDFATWALYAGERGEAAKGAAERAREKLESRWPAAAKWLQHKKARPFIHAGRVVARKPKTRSR